MSLKQIHISARSSHLAQLQAYLVGDEIQKVFPEIEIVYAFRESLGDKNLTDPLWKMPEKGVFTEDFYQDLVTGKTDLIVHSWKDLPVEGKPDTEIAATLPRADQRDILILKKDRVFKKHIQIYTSSPRREYNLKPFFKTVWPQKEDFQTDFQFVNIRGNVPTRLRKLFANEEIDGLVLAKAAVDRFLTSKWSGVLEVQDEIKKYFQNNLWMVLPLSENPNAAAQGALAVECLKSRSDLKEVLKKIHCENTYNSAQKERIKLKSYGGGCHQKIGVTYLKREYGEVFFLKGLTDAGVVLNEQTLIQDLTSAKINSSFTKKWSSASINSFFKKNPQNYECDFKQSLSYISHSNAFFNLTSHDQQQIQNTVIWCAGLETWKKLAQKGVWVSGSSESLGEYEDLRILPYLKNNLGVKFSHSQAHELLIPPSQDLLSSKSFNLNDSQSLQMNLCATYQLIGPELNASNDLSSNQALNELRQDLLSADILYWASQSHYNWIMAQFPDIETTLLSKQMASGVGHTRYFLANLFKAQVLKKAPLIFYNEQEFFK